jgi:hypothetical protein
MRGDLRLRSLSVPDRVVAVSMVVIRHRIGISRVLEG